MRVTGNMLVNNLKRNISRNLTNLGKLDNMLSTGRRINKPSDDPTGIVNSLRLSSRLKEGSQYQGNVADARSWLESSDDALGSLNNMLNRIYEITVKGANGTLSHEDRATISAEIKQLYTEIGNIANATHGDRYLFGGKNTTNAPWDGTAWITPLSGSEIHYEIGAGITVPVNITALEVFQAGTGQDLMQTIQDIISHLDSDDIASLGGSDLERLQQNIDTVLASRAQIGARVNRLDMAEDRLIELEINMTSLKENVEGIDPARVILDMKNQENVYMAALAVGARVIQPTLVDFIR